MIYSNFLRTILKLDAASCLAMGAILVPGATALAGPSGMPRELLLAAGAMLIPLGLFIGWLGTWNSGPSALVWLVILGNAGWSAASLLLAANLPGSAPPGLQRRSRKGWPCYCWRCSNGADFAGARPRGPDRAGQVHEIGASTLSVPWTPRWCKGRVA